MKSTVQLPGDRDVEAVISDVDLDDEVILRADGTRYTEADARADAEEISKRPPGKPSLSGTGTSPQIGVRLPADLRRKLAARAAAEGRRESDVVRSALAAYLSA